MDATLSRRRFLRYSAAAAGIPAVIPASVFGADGHSAPSNKITIGFIGAGSMGRSNLKSFMPLNACRVVAVCDAYRDRCKIAKGIIGVYTMAGNWKGPSQ
jgi:hypothetical protein